MRTNSAGLYVSTICLAGSLAACDNTPAGPGGVGSSIRSLEIAGPREIAPGATVRFALTAHYSDGSTRDVSGESTWRSSDPLVLSVSSGGLGTGHQSGEANVTGAFGTWMVSREAIVVPAGTFRLTGTVMDDPLPGVPGARLDGASVETSGDGAALSTVTDASGVYRLYGVPASAQLRVSKPGFEPFVQNLALSDHQTVNVALTLAKGELDLSGTYALTISASATCRANLPEEVRTRTYTAVAAQRGATVRVRLNGTNYLTSHSQFHNFFDGEAGQMPVFTLYESAEADLPFPGVAEELTETLIFAPTGRVVTRLSPSGMSGALEGAISVLERTGTSLKPIATCSAADHQFVLAR